MQYQVSVISQQAKKMGNKKQFRGHWLYKLIYAYSSVIHRLYYRRITVVGLEKVPENAPVIFAPNHQNALMDALAVLFAVHRPVGFLARADIFKKPFIAKILNLLKILPIYRIRDGVESLGRNQEVFDNTAEVLKSHTPICILPEGNHEGQKRLRSLKKGIFRIAFQAEESESFQLNLHVVPVGLDYSDYFNAGADLMVVFGKPIKISDYSTQYLENEHKTVHDLMEVLTTNMQAVMIHISEKHYQLIYQISEMYEPNVWNMQNSNRHPYNKLTIKQYIIQKISSAFTAHPEKATEIETVFSRYNETLRKHRLNTKLMQRKPIGIISILPEILLSLLLLPIFVYGSILSYFPFKLPVWIAANTKDEHFKSSIHFGIGLLLFPVYYLLVSLVFYLVTGNIYFTFLFAVSLPVTALFAFYYYNYLKKLFGRLRLLILRLSNTVQYQTLFALKAQLIELIKSAINS